MENIWYWILGLYFVSMIINFIFVYKDEDIKTVGDFIKDSWAIFLPFVNTIISCFILIYLVIAWWENLEIKWWERFKNIKIR